MNPVPRRRSAGVCQSFGFALGLSYGAARLDCGFRSGPAAGAGRLARFLERVWGQFRQN